MHPSHIQPDFNERHPPSEDLLAGISLGDCLPLLDAIAYRQSPDFETIDASEKKGAEFLKGSGAFIELVHPADRGEFLKAAKECREKNGPVRTEYRLLPEEGQVLYLADIRWPILSDQGTCIGYRGFWLDLTNQVLTERRLQQAAWHESLYLAMRVLQHDFNNVITGIYVLLDSVQPEVASDSTDQECVVEVQERTARAGEMMRCVEVLNQKKIGQRSLCDVGKLVMEQEGFLRSLFPRSVDFDFQPAERSLPAQMDAVALQAILLSFAANAREALAHRGQVTLSVRKVQRAEYVERGVVFTSAPGGGDLVELVFRDSGCGISTENLTRIVDPYYSTRAGGNGTGLGLFNVRLLAEANGFGFSVVSEVGAGTEMTVTIPLVSMESADDGPGAALPSRCAALVRGGKQPPADSLACCLEQHGWEVRCFSDLAEAERIVERSERPFDIILFELEEAFDLPLPLMEWLAENGSEMLRVLRTVGFNPDQLKSPSRGVVDLILEGRRGAGVDYVRLCQELSKTRGATA